MFKFHSHEINIHLLNLLVHTVEGNVRISKNKKRSLNRKAELGTWPINGRYKDAEYLNCNIPVTHTDIFQNNPQIFKFVSTKEIWPKLSYTYLRFLQNS